jgi:ribosomal 50S subunit-recycling heat shock protein
MKLSDLKTGVVDRDIAHPRGRVCSNEDRVKPKKVIVKPSQVITLSTTNLKISHRVLNPRLHVMKLLPENLSYGAKSCQSLQS